MPEFEEQRLNYIHLFQLFILLAAVPVQYWLTGSSTESVRQYELTKFLTALSDIRANYFNVSVWSSWCSDVWNHFSGADEITRPPEQVLQQTSTKNGHFASSLDVRSPRSPHVKFRIGQVIKHKKWNYKGVIIGWDEKAKAPEEWIKRMHPADRPDYREMPNYSVLIDTRDRLTPQLSYVVEENIEIISNTRVMHPLVEHYFEGFDGAQYLARPWLRKVYPKD